ncbi:unnamed protein product [Paramecium primaurelia]|uniref:Protein kinase domain-containing protein n=1 Tax=Paramecium primaurelia TaxID=5886 RepID=A0A8S1L352_PARPR|nr:unnamed protein product [Paramecium primaurelia]
MSQPSISKMEQTNDHVNQGYNLNNAPNQLNDKVEQQDIFFQLYQEEIQEDQETNFETDTQKIDNIEVNNQQDHELIENNNQQNINQDHELIDYNNQQNINQDHQLIDNNNQQNINQNHELIENNNQQNINQDHQLIVNNNQQNIKQDIENQEQQHSSQLQMSFSQSIQNQDSSLMQDESRQMETYQIIKNDFKKLMEFFLSIQKNDTKVCQWRTDFSNIDLPFENSKEIKNYLILASKNDSDDIIYIQMSILVNQSNSLVIQDQTFTINNICLNQNLQLKIGSFVYLSQVSQIIYEIKQLKLTKKINQIQSIIENAIKRFHIIVNKFIFPLKYKIQFCNTNLNDQYFRISQKSQQQSYLEKFTHSELLAREDNDNSQGYINPELDNEQSKEFSKKSQQLDQQFQSAVQDLGDQYQFCSNKKQKKKKNQVEKLDYEINSKISGLNETNLVDQGGFHKIYKVGINIGNNKILELAVKNQSSNKLRKEIEFINRFLSKGYSKYVAQIYIKENINNYYLLKYYHFKSLRDYIKKYQFVISLRRKLQILTQIAEGIQHLHQHQILHLDIKADNILISKNGNAKICDFGEAYHPNYQLQRDCIKFSVPYGAPELLKHKTQFLSEKADVYSFGTLAYELIFGKLPIPILNKEKYLSLFKDFDLRLDDSKGLNALNGPRLILFKLNILIFKCLIPQNNERPNIESISNFLKCLKKQSFNLQPK